MNPIHLRQTFSLAQLSVKNGNHPFGALLVIDNEVVLISENSVITKNNLTHHAELNLISSLGSRFSEHELARATLYSSTEPCAMCSGAIGWAGIKHVVFGCSAEKLGEFAEEKYVMKCRNVLPPNVLVEGPCLEQEASRVHNGFWKPREED